MPTLCNVTGELRTLSGVLLPVQSITLQRKGVRGQDGSTIVPYDFTTTSNALGVVDFEVYAGNYTCFIGDVSGRSEVFDLAVPEAANAVISNIIGAAVVPITPSVQAAAESAAQNAAASEVAASEAADRAEAAEAAVGYNSLVRDFASLTAIAALADGAVGIAGGLAYISDSTIPLAESAGEDRGVAGLAPYGQRSSDHFGGELAVAIALGGKIDLGGKTIALTAPLAVTVSKNVKIVNGTISYTGAHAEYAVRIDDATGVKIEFVDVTVEGNNLCNKPIEVRNTTTNDTATRLYATRLSCIGAKRSNAFSGASGIRCRGAFKIADFDNCLIDDCELPLGQGQASVVGVSGLAISDVSATCYAKLVRWRNGRIEKVYSSDPSYGFDQDGINCQGPVGGNGRLGILIVDSSAFVNCFGRSIKAQNATTIVTGSTFERTEGLTTVTAGTEIDCQSGDLTTSGNTYFYLSGYLPNQVVNVASSPGQKSRLSATSESVYLGSGSTLPKMYLAFGDGNDFAPGVIRGAKVIGGDVQRFIDWTVSSDFARLSVSDCHVDEIAVDDKTGDRSLIFVRTSAGTGQKCYVDVVGCNYSGVNSAHILRDSVPDTGMDADLSAMRNIGFVDDMSGRFNDNDPAKTQAIKARLGAVRHGEQGFADVQGHILASGATQLFYFPAGSVVRGFLVCTAGLNGYGDFVASNSGMQDVNSGTLFSFGGTSDPAVAGDFNAWVSSPGQISVRNGTTSARSIAMQILSPT